MDVAVLVTPLLILVADLVTLRLMVLKASGNFCFKSSYLLGFFFFKYNKPIPAAPVIERLEKIPTV